MTPATADSFVLTIDQLLANLLTCSPETLPDWIATHHNRLTLSFLQAIKDRYAVSELIQANPLLAERATRYALSLATQMSHEPLALPLAHWARGLYEMFYAPVEAVGHFQRAQVGYRTADDPLSVARLAANLVGVLADAGRFAEAETAYQEAHPEFLRQLEKHPLYLVRLEQNYGWLLHSAGRFAEALAAHDRALQYAQRYQLITSVAEVGVNRNLTLGMLGRLHEVEAGFFTERSAAEAHQQLLTVARIDMNLADLYTWQGRVASALQRYQMAQQLFSELDNEMDVASVLFRQATLLSRIGVWHAALRHYAEALARFTRYAMLPQIGELLVHYAIARRMEGDYRQCTILLELAEQIWRNLGNPLWQGMVLLEQIALAFEREDYPIAENLMQRMPPLTDSLRLQAQLRVVQADLWRVTASNNSNFAATHQAYCDACAYARTNGERWIERRALVGLGKLWLNQDVAQAIGFFEQAASIDTTMRQMLTVEELKASFHEQANDLYDDLIRLSFGRNQAWQALGYIWRAKSGAMLDLRQSVREQAELPSAVVVELEHTRQQIATQRWQMVTQSGTFAAPPSAEPGNQVIVELEQHLLDLRRQRNQIQGDARSPMPLLDFSNPAAIMAQMDADLLFEYVQCGDELWGTIADRHGNCLGRSLCDVETIADASARLQLRFRNIVLQPRPQRRLSGDLWLRECVPLLHKCYQLLVAPLLTMLPATTPVDSVLIAPCASLFHLPFAAFWDGQQFWAEQQQIELLSSAALLAVPAAPAPTYSPPMIIAAAAGAMTGVRSEASNIGNILATDIVFIDQPALAHLCSLPAPPRILHIAAHTLVRAGAPLFTGLQLTGEVLTVEQCYELPVYGTELVTLAGCSTASGQESASALLAFQSAFLIAGARRVLTTLWPISDDATVTWMTHFYRHLSAGLTVPQALQRTQQFCLTDPDLRHPAFWAPFTVTRG